VTTVEDVLMAKGPSVIVTDLETTVLKAAKMMSEANVGSVIVREGGEVRGIFTERDLLRRVVVAEKDPTTTPVGEAMSSPVKSCRLDDAISVCAAELSEQHIRHLAVIEDGALVGLVGLRDVLTVQLRETEKKVEQMQEHTALSE